MPVLVPQGLTFDDVAAVRAARPAAMGSAGVSLSYSDAPLAATPLLRTELVVADRQGHRCAVLPVDFDRRVDHGNAVSLLGSAASGAFRMSLDLERPMGEPHSPPSGLRMSFKFAPHAKSTPAELSRVITWFEALSPNRELASGS